MYTGKVKWFNDAKGWGFITDENKNDVFVHYSNIIMEGRKSLDENDIVDFEIGEADFFCDYEFLPVQNILVLDKLDVETLSQIFNQSYLYETNRVVVYLGKFTNEDIEQAYKNLAEQLASGECKYSKAEYVLALLNEMQKYDAEAIEDPIGEMITFIQWWVEGLRNHVTKDMKDKRYFETEHFKIDFIELD